MRVGLPSSLRARLTTAVVLIALPVILMTALALASVSANLADAAARQRLTAAASSAAGAVERWDHSFVLALQNMRGQPDIMGMVRDDQRACLIQMQKTYDRLEIVRVTESDGISYVRTDGTSPVSYADRAWFKACMSGTPVARQALITKTSGKPALNVSTPIWDSHGRVIGVLSAVTSLASMSAVLGLAEGDESTVTFVVDERGQALAHPSLNTATALTDLSQYPPVRWALDGRQGGQTFTDEQGEAWVAVVVHLSNGWSAVSQAPRRVVLARSTQIMHAAYGIGGAAVLLMAGFAWLMATRMARPIRELTRGADDLAGGDWSRRVPEGRDDEIGRLARSFNLMASHVQTAYLHVEEEVRKRTAELQASERRFRTLSGAAPIGVFECNASGGIVYVNPEWEQITGLGLRDSLGDGWQAAIDAADVEAVTWHWRQTLAAGREFRREFRLGAVKGETRWVSARTASIRSECGEVAGHVGTLEDITERKAAEAQLEAVHRQLLDASRRAGMAEIASSVLHNVGNVLNSLNVSLQVATTAVQRSPVANLGKAVRMLAEHKDDLGTFLTADERGRQIPSFLEAVAELMASEQAAALQEIGALARNVDHIKQIVHVQQSHAKIGNVAEEVQIADLVEDALRVSILSAQGAIAVERDIATLPELRTDKHIVLQILINLMSNAKHALLESGRADKRLTVRVGPAAHDGREFIRVEVIDNGVGIDAADRERIFQHGFTTKKDGHGFGLHSAANSVRQLGGSLRVHSDGPGTGATFTLELPYQLEVAGA